MCGRQGAYLNARLIGSQRAVPSSTPLEPVARASLKACESRDVTPARLMEFLTPEAHNHDVPNSYEVVEE